MRYLRAPAGARRQLRWPAAAAAMLLVGLVVAFLGFSGGIVLQVVPFVISVVALPAAMAAAILADHLYEIDVIINRLVVYLLLAAPSRRLRRDLRRRTTAVPRRGAAVLTGHHLRPGVGQPDCAAGPGSVAATGGSHRLRASLDALPRAGHVRRDVGGCLEPAGHRAAAGRAVGRCHRGVGAVVFVRADDQLLPVSREPGPAERPRAGGGDRVGCRTRAGFDLATRVERGGELLGAMAITCHPVDRSGRPSAG